MRRPDVSAEVRAKALLTEGQRRRRPDVVADTAIPVKADIQVGEHVVIHKHTGEGHLDTLLVQVLSRRYGKRNRVKFVKVSCPRGNDGQWIPRRAVHRGAVVDGMWRPKWAIDRSGAE